MRKVTVKVGFVPSYRFNCTPWCLKMRDDSLAAFARVPGLEVVVPQPATGVAGVEAARGGHTPHGMVASLDEAEAVADYFAGQKVDGLILCPLDFGDERSAAKVAERLPGRPGPRPPRGPGRGRSRSGADRGSRGPDGSRYRRR